MLVDAWSDLLIINLVITVGLMLLTAVSLSKRTVNRLVALSLLALEVDLFPWTFGRLLSHLSTDVAESYFWLRVSFAGICLFGPSVLALTFAANDYVRLLNCRRIALLAAPGVALFIAVLTDDWHHLFFASITEDGGSSGLGYSGGVLYFATLALMLLCVSVAMVIFARVARRSTGWLRGWRISTAVVIALCMVANVLILTRIVNAPLLMAPATISAAVLICALYLFRYWLQDVVRVALSQAAEQMGDALVVLDPDGRVMDANPAFTQVVRIPRQEMVGRSIGEVINALAPRIDDPAQVLGLISSDNLATGQRLCRDVELNDPSPLTYELSVWPIPGRRNAPIGRVATLRDVTEPRSVTESLRGAVVDLEALHQTALAMTSLRDLDVILEVILRDIKRLTNAERAQIAILDRSGSSFTLLADLGEKGQFQLSPISRTPGPLSQQILGGREARFVEDVDGEKALRSSSMDESIKAYAGLSLAIRDRSVGVLSVTYHHLHPFSPANRRLVQTFASHVAVAILNAQMFDEISRAATIDSLTELLNHRHLMQRLDEEITRARRSGHPLTVMMIDVDDFKLVNDAHGHMVGDQILRLVAGVLQETFRASDIIGRYGGDEFLILLPETDATEGVYMAERVVSAIRAKEFLRRIGKASLRLAALDLTYIVPAILSLARLFQFACP